MLETIKKINANFTIRKTSFNQPLRKMLFDFRGAGLLFAAGFLRVAVFIG